MARTPVHLTAIGGKPQGRQAIWEAIRRLRTFTRPDLVTATDIHRDTIRDYLAGLEAAGYIAQTASLNNGRSWTLVKDIGIDAPRIRKDGTEMTQGAARQAMWRAMTQLREDFTAPSLAALATTEICGVHPDDASDYCADLARAQYLLVVRKGASGARKGETTVFRFVPARNTGPLAPMIQRTRVVWDPNEQRIVWHPEVRDV